MRYVLSTGLLSLSTLSFAQAAEQQLDDLIRKYSAKPIQIAIPVDASRPTAQLYPVLVASAEAVSEAKQICAAQGGTGSDRSIFKSGSQRLVQSVRCAKGDASLWYLDFDQRDIKVAPSAAKDGVVADVTLAIERLMPTDPPQPPVLHWKGTFKDSEDEATSKVTATLGQKFGIAHSWRFKPQDIKLLESVWRPAFPGIRDARSGSLRAEYRNVLKLREDCVDPYSCSVTWTFDAPEELVPGMWNVSILADGATVFSMDFEIVRP